MSTRLLAAVLAATGLAGTLVATLAPSARAAGAITLTAQAVQHSVKLGDDIAVLLTIHNPTLDDVTLPELRIAADAVSIRVRGAGIRPSTLTRLYGEFVDVGGNELRLEPAPSRRRVVPAGGSITHEFRFAAVVQGTLELTPSLACGEEPTLTAEPVEIEVTAPGGTQRLLARVETSSGAFTMELDGTHAFNAVAHFWSLARSGFYGDLPVHRVVPGVLVQTGDPRGDGTGTAGWYLPSEAGDEPLKRGDVALARGVHADSGSSQWFVAVAEGESAEEKLAGAYTKLGTVTEGMEVVDALGSAVPTAGAEPRVLRVRTSVR